MQRGVVSPSSDVRIAPPSGDVDSNVVFDPNCQNRVSDAFMDFIGGNVSKPPEYIYRGIMFSLTGENTGNVRIYQGKSLIGMIKTRLMFSFYKYWPFA